MAFPAFRAVLEDGLTDKQCESIAKKIGSLSGVANAVFVKGDKKYPVNEVIVSDFDDQESTLEAARKIPGVKEVRYLC